MQSQKVRVAEEDSSTAVVIGPDSKADDRTPLDDIADRKKKKEKLPGGFKEKLEVKGQKITINRNEMEQGGTGVYEIWDEEEENCIKTDKLRIEGETELVHERNVTCAGDVKGPGRVSIRATGTVLIGKRLK